MDNSFYLPKPYIYIVRTLTNRVVTAIKGLLPYIIISMINAGCVKEAIIKLICNANPEGNIFNVLNEDM